MTGRPCWLEVRRIHLHYLPAICVYANNCWVGSVYYYFALMIFQVERKFPSSAATVIAILLCRAGSGARTRSVVVAAAGRRQLGAARVARTCARTASPRPWCCCRTSRGTRTASRTVSTSPCFPGTGWPPRSCCSWKVSRCHHCYLCACQSA